MVWAHFQAYRDQTPPRSLARAAEECGKAKSTLGEYSTKFEWKRRVASWDRERDRVSREAELEARAETGIRHAGESRKLLHILAAPARSLAIRMKKRLEENPDADPFENMSDLELMREAIKAARVYAQVGTFERLSRDMSTSNVGGHEGGPIETVERRARVEAMPREELEVYLLGVEDGRAVAEKRGLPTPPEHEIDAPPA